ncbi:MAG: DNA polymerase [Chloroflexi bacterium]|nr:DNA polymerase [Chloroflexota bacterium]
MDTTAILPRLDDLLYGRDPTARIVAVEPAGRDRVRLYRRLEDDRVVAETAPSHPWLVLPEAPGWTDLADAVSARELAGPHPYRWLVRCASWSVFQEVRGRLRATDQPFFALSSPVEQYLLLSGRTLFKGLRFDDLLRMQFDIETVGLDPRPAAARVLMIALSTNRGHRETIGAPGDDEADILRRFGEAVQAIDPDIVEGHNVFNFDLPFLIARAERLNVPLRWGRDGSPPRVSETPTEDNPRSGRRLKVGARSIPFADCHLYGRHVIDTYQQIQRYDALGNLAHYGLKDVTQALGLTRPGRTFLAGDAIADLWPREPETVRAYAIDDVLDAGALSALALPTEFYQSQIVPWALQEVATRGPGEKIDDLIVRAYLAAGHSLPAPEPARPYPGGWAEVRATGLFRPVAKADVESLYPSIMLSQGIAPAADRLGLYLPMLRELTRRRLEAKRLTRQTTGGEQAYWQGIQGSFKVLINSFYGYLGYGRAVFNDFDAAERVTLEGQAIIKQVVAALEASGARVIEVDTDGVYFVPPEGTRSDEAIENYIGAISATLAEGINLAYDGAYAGMISLKLKNYILLEPPDTIILRGSSLRSRSEEAFTRRFVRAAALLFIAESRAAVRDLYLDTATRVQQRALPTRDFARVLNVTDKTFTSEATRRLARAAAGMVVGDRIEVYQRQDGTLARIDDYAGDEDVDYLLRRLRDMAGRFADLFDDTADQDYHFPPITARTDIEALRQQGPVRQLSLF